MGTRRSAPQARRRHRSLRGLSTLWRTTDGVAVPADRRLSGWDVLDWDGRLVVAATSTSDPEIWILENASELLDTIDSGAPHAAAFRVAVRRVRRP